MRQRTPLSLALTSSQWQHVPSVIRIRATFSARIAETRFLSVLHQTLQDSIDALQSGQSLTDVKSAFLQSLSRVALTEGMGPLVPTTPAGVAGIEDIPSARGRLRPSLPPPPSLGPARLSLIFDTLTRSAYGYSQYAYQFHRQHDYPAARFIRHPGAKTKRPLHEQNENVVHLFSDQAWWIYMNNRQLGGFEVPWPPYGYNSWMDRLPIPRLQAIQMGLIHEDYTPDPIDHIGFNDRISVDVSNVPLHILKPLRRAFGKAATFSKGSLIFHPQHLTIQPKRRHVRSTLAYSYDYETLPDEMVHYLN